MNPIAHPEVPIATLATNDSPRGGEEANTAGAAAPVTDALATCSLQFRTHTGLDEALSRQLIIAIIIGILSGARMVIGGHVLWCAALHVVTAYNSAIRLALDFAAQIFDRTKGPSSRERKLSFKADFRDACEQHRSLNHVAIGTGGPLHTFDATTLPFMAEMAEAVRGHYGEDSQHSTAIWAAHANNLTPAIEAGRAVGFGALGTFISGDFVMRGAPAPLKDIRELEVFRIIAAPCWGIIEGGVREFHFTPEAERLMFTTVGGRAFWLDDLRKIASIAVARNALSKPPVSPLIDAATATFAVEMWLQNESTMTALLTSAPPPSMVTDKLGAKAQRTMDYWSRKVDTIEKMSPRDLVEHGLAEDTADAKLQLVYLEIVGHLTQVQYIYNGRPLQKWVLSTQRCPTPPGGENTEESADDKAQGPLTSSDEGEAQ